jgi:hypothetical protein
VLLLTLVSLTLLLLLLLLPLTLITSVLLLTLLSLTLSMLLLLHLTLITTGEDPICLLDEVRLKRTDLYPSSAATVMGAALGTPMATPSTAQQAAHASHAGAMHGGAFPLSSLGGSARFLGATGDHGGSSNSLVFASYSNSNSFSNSPVFDSGELCSSVSSSSDCHASYALCKHDCSYNTQSVATAVARECVPLRRRLHARSIT